MQYALGVDGGQSSTLVVCAKDDGTIVSAYKGGSANYRDIVKEWDDLAQSICDPINKVLAKCGISVKQVCAAFCGMTRVDKNVTDIITSVLAPVKTLIVDSDQVSALTGATLGKPGVVIMSGTGAVSFGIDQAGNRISSGGWGYIMGDEGSGFDVGRRGIAAACKALDGRGAPTVLIELIPKVLGHMSMQHLHETVYLKPFVPGLIASAAKAVVAASDMEDDVARQILDYAAEELALTAKAVVRQLFIDDLSICIRTSGGLLLGSAYLHEALSKRISLHLGDVDFERGEYPPAVGCVLLALKSIHDNVPPNVLKNVTVSWESFSMLK